MIEIKIKNNIFNKIQFKKVIKNTINNMKYKKIMNNNNEVNINHRLLQIKSNSNYSKIAINKINIFNKKFKNKLFFLINFQINQKHLKNNSKMKNKIKKVSEKKPNNIGKIMKNNNKFNKK